MLSSTGRISRRPFLLGIAALLALAVAYRAYAGEAVHRWTAFVVYCALLFCGACLVSKRLHDRGRAGWWGFVVLPAVLGAWPWRAGLVDILWGAILLWAAIDLGLMPGKAGANRFGLNPADRSRAAPP
jgi:uncharacterized membrane protein YhaH (DUF805 family)